MDGAPPKLLFHMNSWSWLMLHNFLNPPKQAAAGLDSQLGFSWESPSPALVAAISDCLLA